MDLVEIRKKAKQPRNKNAAEKKPAREEVVQAAPEPTPASTPKPQVEEPAAPIVEPVVEKAPAAAKPAAARRTPVVPDDDIDPLEALFSFRVDGTLATEESYLKALMGDDDAADADQQQLLTFSLGAEEYALDIEAVSEIIKPREVTDIPRVPDFIRGIISLRGIIVPVFDLRGRLKLGTVAPGPAVRIIVCQKDEKMAGFMVDSINHVVNIPRNRIEPPPTVLSGVDRDFVEGVGRVDGRMLILLHLSNVINAQLV